jgi:hypothetical protein
MPVDGILGGVASARVMAARNDIRRVRAVLDSEPMVAMTRTQLRKAMERSIEFAERALPDAGPLTLDASIRVRGLLDECLMVVGGVLLRTGGIDQGACAIADHLIREISTAAQQGWMALTVPGQEERMSYSTGVIGLRFPGPSIWALPIAVHEFGHVVARTLEVTPPDGGQRFNPLMGTFYADGAIPRQREEVWCDFFATYVLGPAYPWAVLTHPPPGEAPAGEEFEGAATALATHPGIDTRIHVTLETLQRMNATAGPFQTPYAMAVDRLRSAANPQISDRSRKLIRLLVSRFWTVVTENLGSCRFSIPMRARWLVEQLASNQATVAPPELRVLDVVAAAWKARVDAWEHGMDTSRHLEGRALDLCRQLVPGLPTASV